MRALNVDTATNQEVLVVGPAVDSTGFFRRKDDEILVAGFLEPTAKLAGSMMMLVFRSIPIESVTDAIFPSRMIAVVENLVEGFSDNGKTAAPGAPFAPTFEPMGRHVDRSTANSVI